MKRHIPTLIDLKQRVTRQDDDEYDFLSAKSRINDCNDYMNRRIMYMIRGKTGSFGRVFVAI